MADLEFISRFYEAVKIPLYLLCDKKIVSQYRPDEYHAALALAIMGGTAYTRHRVCYTIPGEYIYCGTVQLGENEYLLAGPATAFEFTRRQAQRLLGVLGRGPEKMDALPGWSRTIPRCELERFREILCFLDYALNGSAERRAVYVPFEAVPAPLPEADISFTEQYDKALEEEMLSFVEYGKTDELKNLLDNLENRTGGLPAVAKEAVRSQKNIFIFSLGVISRAAMRGGLPSGFATALVDQYLARIETFEGYSSISNLTKSMILDFAQKTARCRRPPASSPLVGRIKRLVNAELYEKISPAIIARLLGMNCSHLCRQFKKETRKTISAFINEMKITEAKRLLESGKKPLAEIAFQLGYSSQNYFQAVFKKTAGVTPGEYRNAENKSF
jgi:AraC-like DNA-binding protein